MIAHLRKKILIEKKLRFSGIDIILIKKPNQTFKKVRLKNKILLFKILDIFMVLYALRLCFAYNNN